MTQNKIELNIVYSDWPGGTVVVFENDKGKVWRSNQKMPNVHNIGMGHYSIPSPAPEDSIWVVEPRCILETDYDINFVSQYRKIFTWATKAFENTSVAHKVVPLHHPSITYTPPPDELRRIWTPWNERSNEIVFVANNKRAPHYSQLYILRVRLADLLSKHFKVSWYGEMPLHKPYYCGKAGDKFSLLNKVKFSVCTENSYDPTYTHGYLSEKMPEVWVSGAVPIYIGCYNIDELNVPKGENAYIDLRKHLDWRDFGTDRRAVKINSGSLLDRIKGFDERCYGEMRESVLGNVGDPMGLYHITSWERMWERMIESYLE